MYKRNLIICFILILYFNTETLANNKNAVYSILWSIENTFLMPESATYDEKRNAFYVSNVNQYAKDNNGFISKVGANGKLVKLRWITGLHSPTGISVYKDTLYVADFDALVAIDLNQEKIIARYEAPDWQDKPVLNDVAISEDGTVYVSGSRSRKIYRFSDQKLTVWLEDSDLLKQANGLFVDGNILIHGGLAWTSFSIASRQPINHPVKPIEKLNDFDGITSDGNGGYFITTIEDPRIWHVLKNGESKPLTESPIQGIDIQFIPEKRWLIVPRVGGSLSLLELNIAD